MDLGFFLLFRFVYSTGESDPRLLCAPVDSDTRLQRDCFKWAVRGHWEAAGRVKPFGFVDSLTNLATKADNRMMGGEGVGNGLTDDKNASV